MFGALLLALPVISLASSATGASTQGTATFVGSPATATSTPQRAVTESVVAPEPGPQEASTDYYLKIEGVDGESSEKKKGNVEMSWKVEEGTKAASIEPDEIDIKLGEAEAAGGVFIKFDDVPGEASGGVNVASGDVDGDGRASIGEQIQDAIKVDGVTVRGWDPEKKKAILGIVPANPEALKSEKELALFAASIADADPQMEQISLNYTKIEIRYNSSGKLFGIIPIVLTQTVAAELDQETGLPVVSVTLPWYAFLASKDVSPKEIEEEAAKGTDKHKGTIEIDSFSWGHTQMGSMAMSLSNILKTKHDTAKNAIGNVR